MSRDVVIDAVLDDLVDVGTAPADVADVYAGRTDWDPRVTPGSYVFLLLRPRQIRASREANEIDGRTIMRDGRWLY